MKKLPVGLQDFKKLQTQGYLYVDKTRYLFELASEMTPFFLSRPRRFGKSLTVSTLKYLFQGERALFEGTWIDSRWDWNQQYPVVHISMTQVDTSSPDRLEESLFSLLREIYASFDLALDVRLVKDAFRGLFSSLYRKTGQRIALLIDEYDKPILDHLHQPERAEEIRDVLRTFYSTIKDADPSLRFVFITGITKFTKAGVFSTLNNLDDITFQEPYATMLGYTQKELEEVFSEHIDAASRKLGQDRGVFLDDLRRYYNGFSFDGEQFVYNPFSVLGFFKGYRYRNYWFESGSPYFLGQYIRKHQIEFDQLTDHAVSDSIFSAYEIESAPPQSFLAQSGYLTFKSFDEELGYRLDFPNQEVKDAFSQLILLHAYDLDSHQTGTIRTSIIQGLRSRDFAMVFAQFQQVFSAIPYHLFSNREAYSLKHKVPERLERYYHAVLLTLLWGCGIDTVAEEPSNLGRSDLVIRYGQDVWVLELKRASSGESVQAAAQKGLEQIKAKGYGDRYQGRSVCLVGVGIDDQKRNLGAFVMESP